MIMYYVEVVPTDIETFASHIKTYQYSVKENVRKIGEYLRSCNQHPIHNVKSFRSRSWLTWNARNLSQIRHERAEGSSAIGA